MTELCDLCGREVHSPGFDANERAFCSSGCRDVYRTLGTTDSAVDDRTSPDGTGNGDERENGGGTREERVEAAEPGDEPHSPDRRGSRTFLRIDGMHSATCEAYLESVAENRNGVFGAEASYVTETIRV